MQWIGVNKNANLRINLIFVGAFHSTLRFVICSLQSEFLLYSFKYRMTERLTKTASSNQGL